MEPKQTNVKTPALSELLETGQFDKLRELIENEGVSVDSPDVNGDTALHAACSKFQVGVVKYLLLQGADPNARNAHGSTPLHKLAASDLSRNRDLYERALELAMLLVECDGDPSAPNTAGMTPYALSPLQSPIHTIFAAKCPSRTLTIERRYLGAMIGKSGKTVERIQKEFGCTIDVSNRHYNNNDDGNDDKRGKSVKSDEENEPVNVVLMGSEENIEKAAKEIEGLVEKVKEKERRIEERKRAEAQRRAEDDTAAAVKVPEDKLGYLIGAKGKNVIGIKKEFGVEIVIPERVKAEAERERPKDLPEGFVLVHVRGKEENVYDAINRIMGLLKEAASHKPQHKQGQQGQQQQKRQQRSVKVVPRFHVTSADPAYAGSEDGKRRRGGRRDGEDEVVENNNNKDNEEVNNEEKREEISMDDFPAIDGGEEEEEDK